MKELTEFLRLKYTPSSSNPNNCIKFWSGPDTNDTVRWGNEFDKDITYKGIIIPTHYFAVDHITKKKTYIPTAHIGKSSATARYIFWDDSNFKDAERKVAVAHHKDQWVHVAPNIPAGIKGLFQAGFFTPGFNNCIGEGRFISFNYTNEVTTNSGSTNLYEHYKPYIQENLNYPEFRQYFNSTWNFVNEGNSFNVFIRHCIAEVLKLFKTEEYSRHKENIEQINIPTSTKINYSKFTEQPDRPKIPEIHLDLSDDDDEISKYMVGKK